SRRISVASLAASPANALPARRLKPRNRLGAIRMHLSFGHRSLASARRSKSLRLRLAPGRAILASARSLGHRSLASARRSKSLRLRLAPGRAILASARSLVFDGSLVRHDLRVGVKMGG